MDDGTEAGVGFVGAHGDAFELLEFAEEVLDEMAPLVDFGVDCLGLRPALVLGDDDLGTALVEISDDGVAVEGLVGDEGLEAQAVDERRHAHRIEAVAWQQHEANQIAERVGQGKDLGGHAALRAAYGLALSPPFAP